MAEENRNLRTIFALMGDQNGKNKQIETRSQQLSSISSGDD
jgi:hypothetical protein